MLINKTGEKLRVDNSSVEPVYLLFLIICHMCVWGRDRNRNVTDITSQTQQLWFASISVPSYFAWCRLSGMTHDENNKDKFRQAI